MLSLVTLVRNYLEDLREAVKPGVQVPLSICGISVPFKIKSALKRNCKSSKNG